MKRKKTPVAAITVLVLAFVGLLISSKQFNFYSKSPQEQMQEMQEKKEMQAKSAQAPSQEVNASQETASLKNRLKSVNAGALKAEKPDDDTRPKEPSVLMPEDKVYVPVKNEATTSSQWYK
jgi:uncharacterized membrane protein YgaE (UPF0421/DUF939 family)